MATEASTSLALSAQLAAVDAELLALLREELNTEEQRMFLDGFAAYLSCDPRHDFVVDLDDVYDWMGFSTKGNAKTKLMKTVVEGKDYTTLSAFLQSQKCTENAANPMDRTQRTLMTVHGFKRLCMAAGTEKAARVQHYYLTIEDVVFEHTRRKMAETAKQLVEHERAAAEAARLLEDKDRALEDKERALQTRDAELERFKSKKYEQVPQLDKVYVCKEAAQLHTDIHKIGKAIDETKREAQFNTGSADGNKMMYSLDVSNGKLVEDIIKHTLKRYHHAREHYNCRLDHTIDCYDIAGTVVDTLASSYEFITREELFEAVINNLYAKMEAEQAFATHGAPPADVSGRPDANVDDRARSASAVPAPTDHLQAFLDMDPAKRGWDIERVEGHVTWVSDFSERFLKVMGVEYKPDHAVLAHFGFVQPLTRQNLCPSCKQIARAGTSRCCPNYNVGTKRDRQSVIVNMRMVQRQREQQVQPQLQDPLDF